MRLRLTVVPTAQRHIRAASRWWLDNRPAAQELFHDELARAFEFITTQPDVAPSAPDVGSPGVRRFYLSRIGYHLYYRHGSDVVEVLALWHSRRGSGPEL